MLLLLLIVYLSIAIGVYITLCVVNSHTFNKASILSIFLGVCGVIVWPYTLTIVYKDWKAYAKALGLKQKELAQVIRIGVESQREVNRKLTIEINELRHSHEAEIKRITKLGTGVLSSLATRVNKVDNVKAYKLHKLLIRLAGKLQQYKNK